MAAAPPLLPRQDTQALPLAPSVRARLLAAGYRTVADLEGVGEGELERGKREDGGDGRTQLAPSDVDTSTPRPHSLPPQPPP
jgi:hypothetical protein